MRDKNHPEITALNVAHRLVAILLVAMVCALPGREAPAAGYDQICDRAARSAARLHAVPLDVLMAVTRTETGRNRNGSIQPWPWTVNMEGHGAWFQTRDAARAYVTRHFNAGARSFDVGCFQINYKWHHHGFRSIDNMFDPDENARYAARFLRDLFDELGNWDAAVGAYHSRTGSLSDKYLVRYRRIRSALSVPTPDLHTNRHADGPIIDLANQPAGKSPLGSLIPASGPAMSFIQLN